MSIEKINIEIQKNPEDLKNPEKNDNYTSVNIERTTDFCKEKFNIPENKKEICNSLNNNFSKILAEKWIDFQELFKTKTWQKLELA